MCSHTLKLSPPSAIFSGNVTKLNPQVAMQTTRIIRLTILADFTRQETYTFPN